MLDPTRAWWSYPLVIVDFETTGIDPLECAPVSIAAIRVENGTEVAHFTSLVNEQTLIPASASAIHGITNEMLVEAPDMVDIALRLFEAAEDALPVAYNAPFDRTIMHRYLCGSEYPLIDPTQRWIDPLVMIRKVDRYEPGSGRHKLEVACKRWGVDYHGEAHNALTDVRMVLGLLLSMIEAGRLSLTTPLGRMLDYIDEQRAEQNKNFAKFKRAAQIQDELNFEGVDNG